VKKMLRVGVVGVGVMGRNHVRVLSEQNVEIVGIYDIDENLSKIIAKQYDVESAKSYDELLEKKPDAIIIATPTRHHFEGAEKALQRGVDVFIEKPITETLEQARRLKELSENNKRVLMVGHIERFNPAVKNLKEYIENGTLGKVVSITVKRVGPYNPRIRDVGIIMDLGPHDFDVISYLLKKKARGVFASAGMIKHEHEDYASINMQFDEEINATIELNWLTPFKMRELTAIGTEGIAILDYIRQELRIYKKENELKVEIKKIEPLKIEIQEFIECIHKRKRPLTGVDEGIYALRVALAALESREKKDVIEI
jgi:UDP-N-acetylglucosamine 3-dehydrogenase